MIDWSFDEPQTPPQPVLVSLKPANISEIPRNGRFSLQKMYAYGESVYGLDSGIKFLTDHRALNRSVPLQNIVVPALSCFLTQRRSFNAFFGSKLLPERVANCCARLPGESGVRAPSYDTAVRGLAGVDVEELRGILTQCVSKAHKNGVLRANAIDGLIVYAGDGQELSKSSRKDACRYCLTRRHRNGTTEHYHRAVTLTTVGDVSMPVSFTMLESRDGDSKDEGELTGMLRLLTEVDAGGVPRPDVLTLDALYDKATLIEKARSLNVEVVCRIKDERRKIFQEASELALSGKGEASEFQAEDRKGNLWHVWVDDMKGLTMNGVADPIRVVKFVETPVKKSGARDMSREVRISFYIVTCMDMDVTTVWKIARLRWDIENCFNVLSQYMHAERCWAHEATAQIYALMLIAIQLTELYLCRHRRRDFVGRGYTKLDMVELFAYQLTCRSLYSEFAAVKERGTG